MSDGRRRVTVVLTDAQYDVFLAAAQEIRIQWESTRRADRYTLMRGIERLAAAWADAPKMN